MRPEYRMRRVHGRTELRGWFPAVILPVSLPLRIMEAKRCHTIHHGEPS
ncbi:hypothetical protein ThimaDRAFT_1985 [Thiocapsa marina 5811]|uniref:Uncharacterized protein n=1 Tax=Thiocapsa marina 5811 TaxID=768671 RepID=F9UAU9_9GAMM|nr:hypothetical protein ThimaDRAFT_1985 [Thiocapsa marina 5811]